MIEFMLTPSGGHRVRFAISPLDEVLAALQAAIGLRDHPPGVPRLAVDALGALPIAELLSVLGDPRYVCEFLSPPTTGYDTTAAAQLAEVRRTPAAQVRTELDALNVDVGGWCSDPGRARDLLADQLETVWTELMAPHWPALRDVLHADIRYRSGRWAAGGLDAAVAGLHPDVRMTERADADAVVVRNPARARVPLDRRGLLLVPSVFTWQRTSVIAVAAVGDLPRTRYRGTGCGAVGRHAAGPRRRPHQGETAGRPGGADGHLRPGAVAAPRPQHRLRAPGRLA
ncbi:DUF5937 family protein [Streptomyces sp. NPDC059578]|uniref:DUF5937 family protein n=1 Tax=Streptomyces sp. NPDC059578 TaxID=3346874 RepID=UPI00369023B6